MLRRFGGTALVLALLSCRGEPARPRGHDDWRVDPTPPVRLDPTGLAFPLDPPSTSPLVAVPAFEKLEFEKPLWLGHARDGSGRVYVAEQAGRILAFDGRPDVDTADVFLDIRDRVRTQHTEEGLLGVAFAPDFARSGHVYLYYSASKPRRVLISRFSATADRTRLDPASERVLLAVDQPYGNHNGGMLLFGPDDHLYIGLGDGGGAGDPEHAGQDLSVLLAKILRVRVQPDGSLAAPPDNPFVGVAGARPEIWAYGLRNPWRCSFDRQVGTMWCGDVGQDRLEEIDIITRGGNYGWPYFEASRPYDPPPAGGAPAHVAPVHEYGRRDGISVTGGFVYRGTHLPAFRGAYFYGDFGSGNVWALAHDGLTVTSNQLVARVPAVSSFGEDEAGELFAVSHEGRIYRFEPAEQSGAAPAFPTLLSETGLFTDTAALAPSPGLLPYDVNVELWSDGARKRRWLAVPKGTTIGFQSEGAWTWPVGTVIVKHFEIEIEPGRTKRLETRAMVHERRGWAGYTYRWNAAQTDAELVGAPQTESLTDGSIWTYPAGSDCLRCHTQAYGPILGLRTRQLVGRKSSAGTDLLDDWAARGLFDRELPDRTTLARHPAIADASVPVADRARAYLDVNCAICHLPDGPAPGSMDLRVATPLAATKLLDTAPEQPIGLADERRVHAGKPDASALVGRMSTRAHHAMPPLATNRVDAEGVALVRAWIESLR